MIILLSLLLISLLVMAAMIYLKRMEMTTGRSMLFFNDNTDRRIERALVSFKRFFRHWNWRTANLLYHFILEKVENFFLRIYRYFRRKLSSQVDMVKGQGNLKENSKAPSSFLKKIRANKNTLNDEKERSE